MKTFRTIKFSILALFCATATFAQPSKIEKVNITLAYVKAYSDDGKTVTFETQLAGSDVQYIKSIEMIVGSEGSKLQTTLKGNVMQANGNMIRSAAELSGNYTVDSFFDVTVEISLFGKVGPIRIRTQSVFRNGQGWAN